MSNTERRQPTLADRFLAKKFAASERYLHGDVLDMLKSRVRTAHKFVLDDNATTRIAHVVRDIPDLLIREYDFARPPFDLTWIEFKHDLFWREVGNPREMQDDDSDMNVGYLIDGNTVSVITGGTIGSPYAGPYPSIIRFHFNTEWSDGEYADWMASAEVTNSGSDKGLDQFLWGGTLKSMDMETRDRLRARNRVTVYRPPSVGRWGNEVRFLSLLESTIHGSVGEMRNIIAMMLMLNRPSITRYSNMPQGKGFSRGKLMTYMAHTSITIDLDAVPTMRLLGTPEGDAIPRRRHEVRGHYCQNREARDYTRIAGCIHDWVTCHDDWELWPNAPQGLPGEPACRATGYATPVAASVGGSTSMSAAMPRSASSRMTTR